MFLVSFLRKIAALGAPLFMVFHVGNGGQSRARGSLFKLLGVLAGVPDLVIVTHGRVIFWELKLAKGTLSEAQKKIHPMLEFFGFPVTIIRGDSPEEMIDFAIPFLKKEFPQVTDHQFSVAKSSALISSAPSGSGK